MKRLILIIAAGASLAGSPAQAIGFSIPGGERTDIRREESAARPAVCVRQGETASVFDRCGDAGDSNSNARDTDAADAGD